MVSFRFELIKRAKLTSFQTRSGYPTSNIHSLPVNVISQDTYYEPQDNTNYYAKLSCNYTGVGSGPCAVANVTWIVLKDHEELTIDGRRAANNSGPPATFVVPEPGCVQHLKVAITPGQGSSYLYACRITDIAGVDYDSQTVSLKNYSKALSSLIAILRYEGSR